MSPSNRGTPAAKGVALKGHGHRPTPATQAVGWETQARDVSARFLEGRHDLNRFITPAPAASKKVRSSPGRPLAPHVRGRLETQFGADLRAIRIHTGPDAGVAARAESAAAFTSGRDIFFGEGRYQESEAGLRLLAHEVTHVLQQTGRRNSAGLLEARDLVASGLVQHDRDYPRDLPASVRLDDLVASYQPSVAQADRPKFQELVDDLKKTVGEDLNETNTNGSKLADRAINKGEWDDVKIPAPFRGLVCDALRALRRHEAAAHFLVLDPLLPCTLMSKETGGLAREADQRHALEVHFGRDPLKKYYPWQFLDTFRRYLYGPTRQIPSLEANGAEFGAFTQFDERLRKKRGSAQQPAENETFFDSLSELALADEFRLQPMEWLEGRLDKQWPHENPLRRKRWMAQMLAISFRQLQSKDMGPLFSPLLKDIIDICDKAGAFWDSVLAKVTTASLANLQPFADREEGRKTREEIITVADLVFHREKGALPSARDFSNNMARAQASLRKFSWQAIEQNLIALTRKDKWDPALALWYGFQLRALNEVADVLAEYRYQDDRFFPGGTPDIRIAARIRLARELMLFAQAFGWEEVGRRAGNVINATEPDQADNELALLGDWDVDSHVEISDLAKNETGFDPSRPIEGFGALSTWDLANLFSLEYYERLAAEVVNILEKNKEEGDYTQWRPRVLARAQKAMADFRKPRRYVITTGNFEMALAPGLKESDASPSAGKRTPFSDLVMAHPKTKAQLIDIGAGYEVSATKDMSIFQLKPPEKGEPLFFWTIPPLEPLVRRLKPIEVPVGAITVTLDELVQAERNGMAPPKKEDGAPKTGTTEAAPPEPEWVDWLRVFMKISGKFTDAQANALHLSLDTARGTASLKLNGLERRAETQDRQLLLKFRVRPLLESYDGLFSTYSNLTDAAGMIQTFLAGVAPHSDQDAHEAAMVLELFRPDSGKDLADVFKRHVERYDLIVLWQTLMRRAVRLGRDGRMFLFNVFTAEEKKSDKWLDDTIPVIQDVIDTIEKRKEKSQLEFGFLGRKPARERTYTTADYLLGPVLNDVMLDKKYVDVPATLVDSSSGGRILAGKDFTIDGVTWRLAEVKLEFEYHPDWGNPLNEETYRPSRLEVEGKPSEVDPKTHRRPTNRELLVVFREGREVHVHENDDAILKELSNAVGMETIIESLEELEEFIEKSTEYMMDVAEFIPGAGQALMAARLATSLISFLASDEFNEIKEKVLEDPAGFITSLGVMIAGELFRPERVLDWILLGTLIPSDLNQLKPAPKEKPRVRSSKPSSALGRFAQLIGRLVKVGEGLYHSLDGVRRRGGQAYLGIETFVHIHPALLLAFEVGADHLEDIEYFAYLISDHVSKGDLTSSFEGFPKSFGGIVEAINTIRIPKEIVPMDVLLRIVLDLIIDRLGSKYKAAGKAVLFVLDKFGYTDKIMKALADEVPDKINPNHYWGEFVDSTLQPMFATFRDDAVHGLSDGLKKLGLPGFEPKAAGDVKLEPSGTEFPEAQAMLSEEPDEVIRNVPVDAPGPGTPLADPVRQHYERNFGHDFSHVRLHTGREAVDVTGRYHADAITTGSHVFLKPGLDPRNGRGAHVFGHELGHVLQQAGSRPLGGRYSSQGVTGQPQRGLRYDPASEAAADRMAAASRTRVDKLPIPVEDGKVYGLQPQISLSAVSRVMRRLSRGEAMTHHYEKLAESQGNKPLFAALPPELEHQIVNLATDIIACFSSRDRFKMPEPFSSKWSDISEYVKGRHTKDGWAGEVRRVALESLHEFQVAGAAADAPKQYRINKRTFHVALEGLLYGNGVACGVVWDSKSIEGDTPEFRIARLDMATLNMPEIGGTSQLWADLMKNTFNVDKGSDEKNRLQPRVRTYLQARGPVWGLWQKTSFALSGRVKDEILTVIAKSGETLKAEDLPLPEIYLSPEATGARPATGYIGLVVGTYASQTGHNKSVERESHHTTQFLLLEYFHNWHENVQPFRHKLSLYPGLVVGSNGIEEYRPKSGPGIKIADLTGDDEWARGPHMPAISLARITHRRGDVHIGGEPDDLVDTDSRKRSHAFAVNNHFRQNIRDRDLQDAMFKGSDDGPLRALVGGNRRDSVQEQIHSAMQATYSWMRDDMRARLLAGLQAVEVDYYNRLATPPGEANPPATKQLTPGLMSAVSDAAIANNTRVMETSAHWS